MKKALLSSVIFSVMTAAVAHADSSSPYTLYGVFDEALRYTTNVDKAQDHSFGASQGLFNGSRLGFKGANDIDSDSKVIYALEAGFIMGTGQNDQQGQLFGRQAWLGVQNTTLGTLTFGRQYGVFSDAVGTGDVFGERHGNMIPAGNVGINGTGTSVPAGGGQSNYGSTISENGFMYQEMGYRWDNSLIYKKTIDQVSFSLMHSFNVADASTVTPGKSQNNTMSAVALSYNAAGFKISGSYQSEKDLNGNYHTEAGVGTQYMYTEKNGVYFLAFNSKFDPSFVRINGTNSEFGAPGAFGRKDTTVSLSSNYYALENVNLIGALYSNKASNVQAVNDSGTRKGLLVAVDYFMSKNADVYLMGASTNFDGSLVGITPSGAVASKPINGGLGSSDGLGNPNTNGKTIMTGFRYRFN